jgi:hypothetical protein
MKPAALPKDEATHTRLKQALASLAITPLQGPTTSSTAQKISGKTFTLAQNAKGIQSIAFEVKNEFCTIKLKDSRGEHALRCGFGRWFPSLTTFAPPTLVVTDKIKAPDHSRLAGSAIWKDEKTLEMRWQFFETPHHDSVVCHFEDNKIKIALKTSLDESWPELTGESA